MSDRVMFELQGVDVFYGASQILFDVSIAVVEGQTMGLHRPFKFVSKASLFSLPLVGWAMSMLRYVRLERGRPHSTRRMLEDCRGWLKRGMAVLMYVMRPTVPPSLPRSTPS